MGAELVASYEFHRHDDDIPEVTGKDKITYHFDDEDTLILCEAYAGGDRKKLLSFINKQQLKRDMIGILARSDKVPAIVKAVLEEIAFNVPICFVTEDFVYSEPCPAHIKFLGGGSLGTDLTESKWPQFLRDATGKEPSSFMVTPLLLRKGFFVSAPHLHRATALEQSIRTPRRFAGRVPGMSTYWLVHQPQQLRSLPSVSSSLLTSKDALVRPGELVFDLGLGSPAERDLETDILFVLVKTSENIEGWMKVKDESEQRTNDRAAKVGLKLEKSRSELCFGTSVPVLSNHCMTANYGYFEKTQKIVRKTWDDVQRGELKRSGFESRAPRVLDCKDTHTKWTKNGDHLIFYITMTNFVWDKTGMAEELLECVYLPFIDEYFPVETFVYLRANDSCGVVLRPVFKYHHTENGRGERDPFTIFPKQTSLGTLFEKNQDPVSGNWYGRFEDGWVLIQGRMAQEQTLSTPRATFAAKRPKLASPPATSAHF